MHASLEIDSGQDLKKLDGIVEKLASSLEKEQCHQSNEASD